MKILVIIIMFIALYLLYRIAFPKQTGTKADSDIPPQKETVPVDIVGKSRFVLPDRSQPQPTTATSEKTDDGDEKANIFAPGIKSRTAVIPPEELDEIFDEDFDPADLDIPPDDDDEIDYQVEEETEAIRVMVGDDALPADGISFEDLENAVAVVMEQPETISEKTAGTITSLENTEMLEMLTGGDDNKMSWIKTVIDRHIQNTMPETVKNEKAMDYGDFDVVDFLSVT